MQSTEGFSLPRVGRSWRTATLCACAAIYLYLVLFVPPLTPFATGEGDDSLFLNEATRILQGQVIYRDFFQFNFAGLQFFYALVIHLFGERTWIPNLCLFGLGMGLFWTSIVISRRLMRGALAFLPGLLFLPVSFTVFLDATHHWYSILLIMVATAVMATGRSNARLALAGGLSGVALLFSQNHGALAAIGFAIFILWEGRADGIALKPMLQREAWFLLPVAALLVAYVVYFAKLVGFANLLFCTFTFLFKYYGKFQGSDWAAYAGLEVVQNFSLRIFHSILHELFLVLLIPGIYLVSTVSYLRHRGAPPDKEWRVAILLTVIGSALFVSVANSASEARLAAVSLPGMVLVIWLSTRSGRAARPALALFWTAAFVMMIRFGWLMQTGWLVRFETPAGPLALDDPADERLYQWLSINTHPGEYVFDASANGIYFRFGLINPTEMPYITPCDLTRPEKVTSVIRDLEKHRVQVIVWNPLQLDTAICPVSTDHLAPLRTYIHANYIDVADFADSERRFVVLARRRAAEVPVRAEPAKPVG